MHDDTPLSPLQAPKHEDLLENVQSKNELQQPERYRQRAQARPRFIQFTGDCEGAEAEIANFESPG